MTLSLGSHAATPTFTPTATASHIASAHNVPSDWWRADVATRVLQRVTDMQGIGLHGTLLGSGGQVLFCSHQGLFTARADGSGLQHLMALETFGTVQWLP